MGNSLRELIVEEQREIERILRALTEKVAVHAEDIDNNITIAAWPGTVHATWPNTIGGANQPPWPTSRAHNQSPSPPRMLAMGHIRTRQPARTRA